MMTRRAPNMTGVSAEVQALFATAKPIIDGVQSAGLGGSTVIAPDNTTDPLPYPDSIILMTDPHNVNGNISETNLMPDGADYATTGSANKSFSFPSPPVGSRVRATITSSESDVMWRHASNELLTGTVQDKYRSPAGGAVDYQVDYIVSVSDGAFFGAITALNPRTFTVRNFRVDPPV